MNIFFTSPNPIICAQEIDDKRLIKMILESAQLLYTALWRVSGHPVFTMPAYRPTHIHHPCAIWASHSRRNYDWLLQLLVAYCDEYKYRYNRTHSTSHRIGDLLTNHQLIPDNPWSNPPPCFGEGIDRGWEITRGYKQTMRDKWQHDKRPPRWTGRQQPTWRNS